ncbi:MAG: hypothetical protein QOJ72_2169, partial [Nocardioidaceae bacterium]|nr:hypothetical protein [Nocardioidaceae bacterium]
RDTATLVLALAAIAIPGFFVTEAVDGLLTPTNMNWHVETAVVQAVPLAWIIGSLYLIKIVLMRRAAWKESDQSEAA